MSSTLQSASIQLRNRGVQDQELYDDPESSLFADSSKRITPFAVTTQSVIFHEPFDFGRTVTATFPNSADLLTDLYLYVNLPTLVVAPGSTYTNWTQSAGFALIESVELLFGNVRVDIRTSETMEIDSYQRTGSSHALAIDKMVGRMSQVSSLTGDTGLSDLYVRIPFHFTEGIDSSIPLFMLDKQRVSIKMKTRPFSALVTYDGPTAPEPIKAVNAFLLADFSLMHHDEKRLWLSRPYKHNFVQWQTQVVTYLPANCPFAKVPLPYANCVKEITWVLREQASEDNNDWFNYASRSGDPGDELMRSASITFDGRDRFAKMPESYYRLVTPCTFRTTAGDRNIYMVSFADKPELSQNTGTANMSRFDDVQLHMDIVANNPPITLIAVAKSYNTLVIENGVASVRFSV